MPGVFSVSPLAPGVASYEGALFEPAHLLTARTAFEQTIAASDAAATPSCSIIYVETHILPSVSSRTHTDFTPLPIRNDATPGALILTNRDDQQFHLRHNRLPVIDSRTIDSTIARAHRPLHQQVRESENDVDRSSVMTTAPAMPMPCHPADQDGRVHHAYKRHHFVVNSRSGDRTPSRARKKLVFKPRHVPRRVPRVQTRPPSPPLLPLLPPPPPSPKPAKSALECAGVTDEISDLVSAEGAYETHEEFLVLMHKVYEKAGLPADRLIGRKEDLEAAATQDDYYDY
ncbi:hypothetical protein BDZ89DRAFT_1112161 [Hymenopellis radicata]|nr:hypothetical protein BDZ89DRAFT_1112161 [Hymenopellis radicata]